MGGILSMDHEILLSGVFVRIDTTSKKGGGRALQRSGDMHAIKTIENTQIRGRVLVLRMHLYLPGTEY